MRDFHNISLVIPGFFDDPFLRHIDEATPSSRRLYPLAAPSGAVYWVLTGGGPGDASRLIVLYIYEIGFRRFEMGYASAVSITLFFVLIMLTLFQFWMSRRWVHYE